MQIRAHSLDQTAISQRLIEPANKRSLLRRVEGVEWCGPVAEKA